jgi:hypothetical protein
MEHWTVMHLLVNWQLTELPRPSSTKISQLLVYIPAAAMLLLDVLQNYHHNESCIFCKILPHTITGHTLNWYGMAPN